MIRGFICAILLLGIVSGNAKLYKRQTANPYYAVTTASIPKSVQPGNVNPYYAVTATSIPNGVQPGSVNHEYPILPNFGQIPVHHPNSIHFVGAGYNILKGNPDGEFWSKVGDDPGLRMTQKILHVSQVNAPPELEIEHRDTCSVSHEYNLIYNEKSYQHRLMEGITTSGDADSALADYAFTLSEGYHAIQQQTGNHNYIYQDYTSLCSMGHARFKMHLAKSDHLSVEREFAAAVCELPTAYDENSYMKFIDEWGTHMILEVEVGKKTTYRYGTTLASYFSYLLNMTADEVTIGGPLKGFESSYIVNMDSFKYRAEYRINVGQYQEVFGTGNTYYDDEVELVLATIDGALNPDLWQFLPAFIQQGVCPQTATTSLGTWKSNIVKALKAYPQYKNVSPPPDKSLAMPLTWPYGTYGLPTPKSGCPNQFTWSEGSRTQMSASPGISQNWLNDNHFKLNVTSSSYTLNFCTKERAAESQYGAYWPKGDYCVYKYGTCPYGFRPGTLHFDDSNTIHPGDASSGVLPDGVYKADTTYTYCCRSDGSYLTPIILPRTKPFYLLKNKHGCQRVKGMVEREESLTFSTEGQANAATGSVHPANTFALSQDGYSSTNTVAFCYYSLLQGTSTIIG